MADAFDDQVHVQVDSATKEQAKENLGHGGISELVRRALKRAAWGEEVSERERLERRIEELREQRDQIKATIRRKQADLEEVDQEIARLEERKESKENREDRYEAALEMLESDLYEGQRLFTDHPQVQQAARIGDVDPSDVIAELQDRNPAAPDYAFQNGLHDDRTFRGLRGDPE